jgi:hypothetical protein
VDRLEWKKDDAKAKGKQGSVHRQQLFNLRDINQETLQYAICRGRKIQIATHHVSQCKLQQEVSYPVETGKKWPPPFVRGIKRKRKQGW